MSWPGCCSWSADWGLVAIARFDLVATVFGLDFGETSVASRLVYAWSACPRCTCSPSFQQSGNGGRRRSAGVPATLG